MVTEVTEVGPRAKVAVSRGHYDDSLVDPQKKLVRKDKTSPPPSVASCFSSQSHWDVTRAIVRSPPEAEMIGSPSLGLLDSQTVKTQLPKPHGY